MQKEYVVGQASIDHFDDGSTWTKESVNRMRVPNYDYKLDHTLGLFNCRCGTRSLYLMDDMYGVYPKRLCKKCFEKWKNDKGRYVR